MVKSRIFIVIGLVLVLVQPAAAFAAPAQTTLRDRVEARRAARQPVQAPLTRTRMETRRSPRVSPSKQAFALDRRRMRIGIAVIEATNAQRAAAGLAPVTWNRLLEQSAQLHAEDMNSRKYFAHESPEGVTSGDRILATSYGKITQETCDCQSYRVSVGENLAHGQQTVEKVMRDWMASPGHKENILQPLFHEIGIGISGRYWVQHFGGVEKD